MIYITGDIHGDIGRFRSKELRRLRKTDTLIVCGDFGFVWDDSPKEKKLLRWIGRRRYSVLFLEGTHDNLELLAQYPEADWNGGKVREISGRLRQLCRGEIFRLEDKDVFVFGGGEVDSEEVENRPSWSGGELPTMEELERARANLEQKGDAVDYIVTHQPSRKIRQFLDTNHHDANMLDAFLDEVRKHCSYKHWYFGSLHINKKIPPSETALYDWVVPVE